MGQKWDDFLRDVMGKERADRHQEKRTGMTYIQRQAARDPNVEVWVLDMNEDEYQAWQDGLDPFTVGPEKSPLDLEME
jgi:hypothetical protein